MEHLGNTYIFVDFSMTIRAFEEAFQIKLKDEKGCWGLTKKLRRVKMTLSGAGFELYGLSIIRHL